MAAYAALVSALHLIEQIQHHPCPPVSLDKDHDQSLTKKITFLQEFLEEYSHVRNEETVKLQSRIADAAYEAEDVIESHLVDQILTQSKNHVEKISGSDVDCYQALERVIGDMDLITQDVRKILEKMASPKHIEVHTTVHTPLAKASHLALWSLDIVIVMIQHHPVPLPNKDQLQSLKEKVKFLQTCKLDSLVRNENIDRLQSRMVDAVYNAADVFEFHIIDQILDQYTTHGKRISIVDFYQGLQKVIDDMDLIMKEVVEIKERMGSVRDIQQDGTGSTSVAASSRSSSTKNSAMVGFDDTLEEIMDKLTRRESNRQIIAIVGMGGIGKTTLAKNVYANPLIVQHFDICAWTTISQEFNEKKILLDLLRNQGIQGSFSEMSEEELGERFYKTLCGRRYLIVMDDTWNIDAWYKLKRYFPQSNCESSIIITSRLSDLASHIPGVCGLHMSFLNEDKSRDLFCRTVFGEDGCPPELEKIGNEIAKRCKGLPLSIVVIGGLLTKSEQTREYWEYIAKNLSSVVNLEDNEQCLNVLYMSYDYLPVHLKPCFLYMGIYGEDDEIFVSKLIKSWVAEGFLKPISGKSLEEVGEEYLKALVDRNLILVDKWKPSGKPKLCKMHDLLRDLCLREAQKDKFLCVTREQSVNKLPQDINTPRRIAIDQNRLWHKNDECCLPGIRDAFQLVPRARSLIRFSPQVLPSFNFRLLRVLETFDDKIGMDILVRTFPFQLVNLRFLSFSFVPWQVHFHRVPSSLYLFWNLQTLIVSVITTINFDIWKLPLLRHVKWKCLHLNDPAQDDFVLGDLRTLSTIENFKCDGEVVKRIPNIQKLKISYTTEVSDCCLNNLGHLHKLESLNCKFLLKLSGGDLVQNLMFPHSLKKLTLEGCCLHCRDISTKIGSLPHLQVLNLGRESFVGLEWETVEGQFLNLKFLELCSIELQNWTTEASHFPCLVQLSLNNLWSLKEIPLDIGNIPTLKLIWVYNCNGGAIFSSKEIAEEQNYLGNEDLKVQVTQNLYG